MHSYEERRTLNADSSLVRNLLTLYTSLRTMRAKLCHTLPLVTKPIEPTESLFLTNEMSPEKQNTERARLPGLYHLITQGQIGSTSLLARNTDQHRERLVRILNEALELLERSVSSWDPNHESPSPAEDYSHQDDQHEQ